MYDTVKLFPLSRLLNSLKPMDFDVFYSFSDLSDRLKPVVAIVRYTSVLPSSKTIYITMLSVK